MGRAASIKPGVFLLFGVIFSGIVSIMYLTGSINLECFYDVGNLYDFMGKEYESEGEYWRYDEGLGVIEAEAEGAKHSFPIQSRQKNWNYFCVEAKNISKNVRWDVEFLNQKGGVLYVMSREIQDGRNILQLQKGQIHAINIIVSEPCSFSIQGMQLRERLQTFGWAEVFAAFAVVFAGYLLLWLFFTFLLRRAGKRSEAEKRTGQWLDKVQEFYERLLDQGVRLQHSLSQTQKSRLRRLLFFASLLIMHFMLVGVWGKNIVGQRRTVAALGACLLIAGLLSWEKRKQPMNWKNPLTYAWFALWTMCVVSEFITGRATVNAGIFMLIFMGPFYLAFNSMKSPQRLIRDFLAALRWSYWAASFFCIFFRPFIPGLRYLGIFKNPNGFGGYLVTVNIAFLIWLDENLNRENLKYRTLLKNVLGIVSLWGFLQLADSITAMAVYVIEWVVFIWKQFPNEKDRAYSRNLKRLMSALLICMIFVQIPGKWCLANLPAMLGTEMEFPGDAHLTASAGVALSLAAEPQKEEELGSGEIPGRLLEKVESGSWSTLFSGRDRVWMAYIRQLNLFGHAIYPDCIGTRKMQAHNSLLQMMYDYGVFIAIPYLLMMYYSFLYGVKIIFKKSKIRAGTSLFFLLSVVNFVISGVAESIETPYVYVSWLMYFIAVGGLFNQPEELEA